MYKARSKVVSVEHTEAITFSVSPQSYLPSTCSVISINSKTKLPIMSDNITIIIKNKSDQVEQFMIFNDKPAYSKEVGEAWTNVWGTSPGIGAQHGSGRFGIQETFYAVCGMEPKALAKDLVVSTSDYEDVKLGVGEQKGTDCLLEIVDGGAVFNQSKVGTLDKNGSFGIRTDKYDLTKYKNAFCGLGMKSPVPNIEDVVPVSVWQAKPNQAYQITPKRIYYISTGDYKAGRIVNVAEFGKVCTIDFTGRKETIATVIYNNDLDYEKVEYSFDS
ncbi:uncharacterized protein K460DRAFT_366062 [Cucurbitaria berberidis CBS 394.84]|uniref:Uncharacterized protein n=1 Tax=Cucurbitaria berberidis CBS 394.84 TaxID=1168544 RepID=A0A9P4GGS8_9PLEO|nr:uncharacterized protein K460DRAFT_366062 [Cucurbitaria berberidis CBS 394.84]KAF1845174.1 hypothetical protein K460DRAFT_366062 [Cucurbitaria berberidis CBS 394.84]